MTFKRKLLMALGVLLLIPVVAIGTLLVASGYTDGASSRCLGAASWPVANWSEDLSPTGALPVIFQRLNCSSSTRRGRE